MYIPFRIIMKYARYISSLLIFISIYIIIFGISFLHSVIPESPLLFWFFLWGIFSVFGFLIVKWVVYFFYDTPIKKLEYAIKRFLVGSLKDNEIQNYKTTNPHLNYILLFFTKTLGTLKHIKSEFLHGKEIKSEVNLAGEIQGKLLGKKLHKVPHLQIIAKSIPAWEIGWDSYDVISQWDNHYIYVWDATWHGVWAGFIMMMVNALVSWYAKVTDKWSHILALTNDIIKPRVKANLLMSMLMIRWNDKTKKMYMTWAGHEYLMIYKHSTQKCFKIKSGWVALWMTQNIHKLLKERELAFEPNDVIILYSDGITEAINQSSRDGNEKMFGEDLLVSTIESSPEIGTHKIKTARSIFKNISITLSKFMGYKHVQLDDITLVTIQYESPEYILEDDCSEEMSEDFITEWKWTK